MREEGRGWRRVYKLVIWGTGHVRGSRSLRRRNKSATYDPAFPFPSSPPTDFLPPPTSLSGSPSSSSSYSSYYSSTIPFLRARPRLFIRELPSLIISPSLFRSGVAAMALTAEQIFQWFNGASRWKYRPYTRPRVPFIFPKKRLRPDISIYEEDNAPRSAFSLQISPQLSSSLQLSFERNHRERKVYNVSRRLLGISLSESKWVEVWDRAEQLNESERKKDSYRLKEVQKSL